MPDWLTISVVLWLLRSLEHFHIGLARAVVFSGRGRRLCRASPSALRIEPAGPTPSLGNVLDPLAASFVTRDGPTSRLDVSEADRLLTQYEGSCGTLLRAEVALGAHLFLVVPIVWAFLGITATWPYLLGGMIVLQTLTLVEFGRAHIRLCPAEGREWIWKALPLLLAPPAATAGHLALTKPLLGEFHPVAAAAVLCSDERFRALAIPYLRCVEFRADGDMSFERGNDAGDGTRVEEIRRIIEERLGAGAARLTEPRRRAASAISYCPRCLAEYSAPLDRCADCGGVPLKRFEIA